MPVARITRILPAVALLGGSAFAEPILLDPAGAGRTYDGIGAVSAGASSRLLIDYPEPQRGEILDYLFKPGYGASLQHLKVEIGGDVNSTDGVEPSHMRTRGDEDYTRGYEWWLMKEAVKRNPGIALDCLAWGAPAWIGDGHYFSQDMADAVARFIQGAKRVHGLDIRLTGIANERYYDVGWIKLLRKTLDANGLNGVGIVAADQSQPLMIPFPAPPGQKPANPGVWDIAEEMNRDPALKASIHALGAHYPFRNGVKMSAAALASGVPLWSSEDGPWSGDWLAGPTPSNPPLQAIYNRNYVICRITRTEIWSPVTSYYDNLPVPGSGLMRANTPWSGHYEIPPSLWVTAHTTQFAQPGWKYIDGACRMLAGGGSCVALASPDGKDLSIILESCFTKEAQTLQFRITAGLSGRPLHVWRTDGRRQFEQAEDCRPDGAGIHQVVLEPNQVISLTTTTGQRKGGAVPPAASAFPLPYRENFAGYAIGSTPRYWSDFSGVFEVAGRGEGGGRVLRQVLPKKGIEWCPGTCPESFCGDVGWRDYSIAADAMIEGGGFVSLFGRVTAVGMSSEPPKGYCLKAADSGDWELDACKTRIAGGKASFPADRWHHLKLSFHGKSIAVEIDGKSLATVEDATFDHGNAGIGCGWHGARFADLAIDTLSSP